MFAQTEIENEFFLARQVSTRFDEQLGDLSRAMQETEATNAAVLTHWEREARIQSLHGDFLQMARGQGLSVSSEVR